MVDRKSSQATLEGLLEVLGKRYRYDGLGRIVGLREGESEADAPRFVFVRTREGCAWRIHADLTDSKVAKIARWAGRERALAADDATRLLPPERLVLVERELAGGGDGGNTGERPASARREVIEVDGRIEAEIWVID